MCESYHSMVSGQSKQGWIPTQEKTNILIAASRKPHFILKKKNSSNCSSTNEMKALVFLFCIWSTWISTWNIGSSFVKTKSRTINHKIIINILKTKLIENSDLFIPFFLSAKHVEVELVIFFHVRLIKTFALCLIRHVLYLPKCLCLYTKLKRERLFVFHFYTLLSRYIDIEEDVNKIWRENKICAPKHKKLQQIFFQQPVFVSLFLLLVTVIVSNIHETL